MNWDNDKCGYCEHQEAGPLPVLTCPKCGRKGCSTCMPNGELQQCPACDFNDQQEQALRPY